MKKFFKIEDILDRLPKREIKNEVWANPGRDWVVLLLFFSVLFLSVFGYSMYRFYVWQNLEEFLPERNGEDVDYKKGKAQKVMSEFDEMRVLNPDVLPVGNIDDNGNDSGE